MHKTKVKTRSWIHCISNCNGWDLACCVPASLSVCLYQSGQTIVRFQRIVFEKSNSKICVLLKLVREKLEMKKKAQIWSTAFQLKKIHLVQLAIKCDLLRASLVYANFCRSFSFHFFSFNLILISWEFIKIVMICNWILRNERKTQRCKKMRFVLCIHWFSKLLTKIAWNLKIAKIV